jgi:hypothetical protein
MVMSGVVINLLPLLEAMCKANDKHAVLGFMRAELRLWRGGCPAPTDAAYAEVFIPALEAAVRRLEAAESDAFLEGERRIFHSETS